MPLVLTNRRRRGGSASAPAFSPSSLYSSGSQGIWLDPSDLSTMFSDRAGTTPVTTPGTVVGLRLDKSKGLTLGAELVVNGGFATDTDWTKGTGWTIIGGEAVSTAAANSIRIHQHTATTYPAAVVVEIRYTITSLSSGAFAPVLTSGIGGSIVTNGLTSSAPGTYTQYIVSTGTFTGWGVRTVGITTGTIDNISVRELPGNHAAAPTDAARPTYGVEPKGGRRNLLTWSEAFSESVWAKTNATVTENTGTAPDGTTTADKLVETAVTGRHIITSSSFTFVAGVDYAYTIRVKAAERQYVQVSSSSQATSSFANFDVSAGTKTAGTTGFGSIAPDANGFYEITIQFTAAGGSGTISVDALTNPTAGRGLGSYTGDGTSGILIWGAQLELGPTATNYQRVLSAYDITESGVATTHYVQYDGSDDSMSTAAIDFTATDKMSVFAGVRKLSDAATGTLIEFSASLTTNNGSFFIQAPTGANDRYGFTSKGTVAAATFATGYGSPISNIVTGLGDISGDLATLRANGVQAAQSTGDQGTGNFGNYPLFIGRRNNTLTPFNGRDYGIIVVGKAASSTEITDTETWLAAKTSGVTI